MSSNPGLATVCQFILKYGVYARRQLRGLKVNIYLQTKFHPRLWYNYFQFGKTHVRHILILLPLLFLPRHQSWNVIVHQPAKFLPNWTTHGRNMTSCQFLRWQISATLDIRGPIRGSLKSPCRISYRLYRNWSLYAPRSAGLRLCDAMLVKHAWLSWPVETSGSHSVHFFCHITDHTHCHCVIITLVTCALHFFG